MPALPHPTAAQQEHPNRLLLIVSLSPRAMGNCLTNDAAGAGCGSPSGGGDGQLQLVQLPAGRACRKRSGGEEEGGGEEEEEGSSVLKVKMVLTKAELEWLMAQLKAGDRRLEDVLREMARKRDGRPGGWRPSLESIVECHETGSDDPEARITVRDIV